MRPVSVVAASLYCPAGIGLAGAAGGPAAGPVPRFDPLARGVPRKHLKTMTRAVQLGVAAVSEALAGWPAWAAVAPERRGLFVGASPQSGDPEDLAPALAASAGGGLGAFARKGVPLIPPLWLVKGLSNNILGYASAQHDLRGDNGNWCDGRLSGIIALGNAIHAVAEGRVDLAVAGAADALAGADAILGAPGSDGAAFFVLVAGEEGPWRALAEVPHELPPDGFGELGAAAGPVVLARAWLQGHDAAAGGVHMARTEGPFTIF